MNVMNEKVYGPQTMPETLVREQPIVEGGARGRVEKDAEEKGREIRARWIARIDKILGFPGAANEEINHQAARTYEIGAARINNLTTRLVNFTNRTVEYLAARYVAPTVMRTAEMSAKIVGAVESGVAEKRFTQAEDLAREGAVNALAAELQRDLGAPERLTDKLEEMGKTSSEKAAELAKQAAKMETCQRALTNLPEFRNGAVLLAETMSNPAEAAEVFHLRRSDRIARSTYGKTYGELDDGERGAVDIAVVKLEGNNVR